MDEQLGFWEQYGQEIYPEGIEVTEVALPAGDAVRQSVLGRQSDRAVDTCQRIGSTLRLAPR